MASHPKKTGSMKKQRTKAEVDVRPQIVPIQHLTSAWDDYMRLSNHGTESSVLLTALQTNLQGIVGQENDDVSGLDISLPTYAPSELQPHLGGDEFNARARCLARLRGVDETYGSTCGYCVFLFEVKSNVMV